VSSLGESSYHRLPKELADRNAVRETILGGNVHYTNNFMSAGFTLFQSRWNCRLSPEIHPYNRFSFSGNRNLNMGMDLQFKYHAVYLFGEGARSSNGGLAWLCGLLAYPDPSVTFSLVYRDYHPDYQDLLSNAVGRNSSNSNERGFQADLVAHLPGNLVVTAFADIYRFPWLKYQADFVSHGAEYRLQANGILKKIPMYLRFRVSFKQTNEPGTTEILSPCVTTRTTSVRYQAEWPVMAGIRMTSRIEVTEVSPEQGKSQYGYLFSQDAVWKLPKLPFTVSGRYALFDTDGYEERIYAYEPDVLYGYTVPACEGKGIRCMLMVTWSPLKKLEVWARYAQTFYSDRNVIGTGLEEIDGNTKSEVKLQLRVLF
jgi:hypothetical protein